jgi:citrate lyase subunit beta/citryl-CoA lyase
MNSIGCEVPALSRESRMLHRSYLYAPGSRPEVMRKALRSGADAVVFDLEDAVAPPAKAEARDAVVDLLERGHQVGDPDIHVRVNRHDDGYDRTDLRAIVRPGLSAIRLPKAEHPGHIAEVAAQLDSLEAQHGMRVGSVLLYPIVESARGMAAVDRIATVSTRIARFSFGSTDLLADLGIHDETPLSTLAWRSELVLRSRVAMIGAPIDSVHTALSDSEGLRDSTSRGASLGFYGRSVIHPSQLAAVHEIYTPSANILAEAARIVAAADATGGAFRIEGQFVDAAVVARARAVLNQGSTR